MDTTTKYNAKAAAKVDTVVGARTTTLTSPAAKATATTRSACVITVNGCVAVEGGLGVNAGADVDFFGLFNKDTTVPLFNKKFDLFKVSEMSINMEDAHLAPLLSLKLDAMRKGPCHVLHPISHKLNPLLKK